MQNKAAISANATQHEIIQESAERQRQEEKAAKQLASKQAELKTLEKVLEGFQQLHDGKL